MVVENGKIFKAIFLPQSTADIRAQFPAVFRGYFGCEQRKRPAKNGECGFGYLE